MYFSKLLQNRKTPLHIIIVGETGAGKSSVINLLADKELARVSPDVATCTEDFTPYSFEVNSTKICAYDTMGFAPAQRDDSDRLVPYERACELIQSLKSKIDIVFLCTKKDRLDSTTRHVFHLFNDFFFDGTVPIVLVATYREREISMDDWWNRNSKDMDTFGLHFAEHACVTTIRSENSSDPRYQQSRKALVRLLGTATRQDNAVLVKPARPLLDRLVGAPGTLTRKCGLSDEEAELLTGKIKLFLRMPNIVLFGESGAGKSSVINLIAGEPIAPVSSLAKGCTLDSTEYRLAVNDSYLRIFDTIGLNNVTVEEEDYLDAVKTAHKLINGLNRAGGVDLLLFCIRGGRLNEAQLSNYRLFQGDLCEKKVPVVIVVTHLEQEDNMEQWWTQNEEYLEKLKIKCVGHACVTAINKNTDPFRDKLEESRKILLELLTTKVKEPGTPFVMETDVWLSYLLKKMGKFIRGGNLPEDLAIRRMLVEECNIPPKRADAIIAQLRPRFW